MFPGDVQAALAAERTSPVGAGQGEPTLCLSRPLPALLSATEETEATEQT